MTESDSRLENLRRIATLMSVHLADLSGSRRTGASVDPVVREIVAAEQNVRDTTLSRVEYLSAAAISDIRRIVRSLARSTNANVDDVVQEVCLAILRSTARPPAGTGAYNGWVFQIARYKVIDAIRRRRPHVSLDDDVVETRSGWTEELIDKATRLARHCLPPRLWETVQLELGGLSTPEIADSLGITENAVRKYRGRAYKKLRGLLGGDDA